MTAPVDGLRPPQQERSRRTLEHLLQAGAEVLAERGYDGLSVAEVCRRAGISAGALYTRFEGKDALVRAIHAQVMADLSAEVAALYAPSPEWDALPTPVLIEQAVRGLVSHFRGHAAIVRAIVLRAAVDSVMRAEGAIAVGRMADAFTRLLLTRAADVAAADPEATVRAAFTMVFETTSWDVTFGSEFRATGALGPEVDERLVTVCRLLLTTAPAD